MRRALVLAALAAGCSETSLAIEVASDNPAITHVELLIVDRACSDCSGVAPPTATERPEGKVAYTAGTRFTAPVTGGIAGFRLEAGGASDDVPALVAIGFGAGEQPLAIAQLTSDFHVNAHLGEIFHLDLVTRRIDETQPAATGDMAADSVVVWRAPNADPATTPSCLAFEPTSGTNTFVVPPDDPDCDGITGSAECDAFWYQYAKPNPGVPQLCFAQPAATSPCTIGTETTCIDGQAQDGCTPGATCVPARVCETCQSPTDPQCASHVGLDSSPGVPRLRCTVPLVGAANTRTACTSPSPAVNLDPKFNAFCMPGFVSAGAMLPLVPTGTISFDTGQGTAMLTISQTVAPCEFQIAVQATTDGIPNPSVPGLLVLKGSSHQLVMPLVVEFSDGGTACVGQVSAPSCTIEQSSFADPIWTCGQ